MEEKVTILRLNLGSDDVRNFKETTFAKKGVLNLAYIQRLLFEKSKQSDKLRTKKTRKSARKASKTMLYSSSNLPEEKAKSLKLL